MGIRPPDPDEWAPDEQLILGGMRAFGAPAAEIERVAASLQEQRAQREAKPREQGFGVYQENMPVVEAWCSVETQWQYAGMGAVMTGLNYAGVQAWLQIFIKPGERASIMRGLQVMERAALGAMHELRQQEKER